ncbi:methylglyoxal synthase [Vagococcus carniphilus]|uniref:Methylglyoxal synthase n=1 Tax=Vagococcus carniphilus TaxID=218144 RepID=A0A430B3K5_9ENTE|nr:methylglyoxal synthase [Vagococcus carniphilus]QNN73434.1 methylglyoxal synthase [Vagococcus carniphilus]RSU14927.1 methylglyoxal synthase [Vagococcus carniphilus]
MKIALIAHDKKKKEIIRISKEYEEILSKHELFGTGTTGTKIMKATDLKIHLFKSGPLGGDQQIGARVSEGEMDMIIFLRDPLTSQPHEPDVNALIRLSDVYEIPLATNKSTAILLFKELENLAKNRLS